jgi:hypothetical protein
LTVKPTLQALPTTPRDQLEQFIARGQAAQLASDNYCLTHSLGIFKNEAQRSEVVRVMLASLHLDFLWVDGRPTEEACGLMEEGGGYLSSGERALLFAAWDVWNGEAHLPFDRLLYGLDPQRMLMMGTFLVAFATGTIDQWLTLADAWQR